jgi:hypothetical protein
LTEPYYPFGDMRYYNSNVASYVRQWFPSTTKNQYSNWDYTDCVLGNFFDTTSCDTVRKILGDPKTGFKPQLYPEASGLWSLDYINKHSAGLVLKLK